MNFALRLKSLIWLLALLSAAALVVWTGDERARRVQTVTLTEGADAVIDPASPTGYADGKRWLIVPERNSRSYEEILQTQQMFARGEWRVRHVDYDNAPEGREVHAASLYRWWLGGIAWVDHVLSDRPIGLSVERAALWSEPLLHLLLLVTTTVFVARQFGNLPATLIALGLAAVFPLAASFLPGVPDDHSLARVFALGSILPLLAALVGRGRANDTPSRAQRLFVFAGVAGGLGLWVNAGQQAPILLGIALGGGFAALVRGRGKSPATLAGLPWPAWSCAGAATSLAGYLVEYFPSHLGWQLRANHPLYAISWLGLGQLMFHIESWRQQGSRYWNVRRTVTAAAASLGLATLPVMMYWRNVASPWAGDLLTSRLTFLPNRIAAGDLSAWLERDGPSAMFAATFLPLLIVALAIRLLVERGTSPTMRAAVMLALGPVAVAVPFAFKQLSWWAMADATLLALALPAAAALPVLWSTRLHRWLGIGLIALIAIPSWWQLRPAPSEGDGFGLSELDVVSLIERGLAHWLADRTASSDAVMLVPPDQTISMSFHGGFRGLGSSAWENRDGLTATAGIVAAANGDEALARLNDRGVTHIVLPSWDPDLEQFARAMLPDPRDAFIIALQGWAMPTWLRPLPYRLPSGVGFDDQSVKIFAVSDDSSRAAATARVVEYFLESEQPEEAAALILALEQYPTDLGALAARAHAEQAIGDAKAFEATMRTVLASLAAGTDRFMPWDRRVSLAVVLALSQHHEAAREQVQRCLDQLTDERIRALTTASLFRLLSLARAYRLPFGNADQVVLARKLLPAELRRRL